jgi:GNAT superfamily N-acetyltransferase
VILVEATPELSRERSRATHEAWGGPLCVASYVALEERLRGQPWPRATMSVWLLCAEGGEVLASCETYRMPSQLLAGPVQGHSYGIASVYTEPSMRRRGYVTELLSRLGEHLVRTDPDAQAMTLFSDVPLSIYEKSGFTVRPALNLAFGPLPGDPLEGVDELLTEDRVAEALAGMPCPADPFTIRPVPAQIGWHLERERMFAELNERRRPPACGARIGGGTAFWSADYRPGQLTLLLLHAPGRAEADALVACARRMANAVGLMRAVLWLTPRDLPFPQALLEDRQITLDSVPMIRPLDPRVRASDWAWIPRAVWV